MISEIMETDLTDVYSVDLNPTARSLYDTEQSHSQRGFTRACPSHYSYLLLWFNVDADALNDILLIWLVFSAVVGELNATFGWPIAEENSK